MILLPDEDEMPVGALVNALVGEALRQSVADIEPSPGFQARLTAALDAADAQATDQAGPGEGRQAGEAAGDAAPGAGPGAKTVAAAS
ncbi:hypothetical protein SAMN05518865_106218 [Duganella sp. CF458]|uniref:hypothetical protein n=1 Tax=Duganella sp. CF458 TaxID=1884368 RepID=UPI0008F02310|nr:hypothetical protein [Duganella sp. CF458]SFF94695.1 hypothetical protein SAMN05518865_106218 [Duganella sp. CF458]